MISEKKTFEEEKTKGEQKQADPAHRRRKIARPDVTHTGSDKTRGLFSQKNGEMYLEKRDVVSCDSLALTYRPPQPPSSSLSLPLSVTI